MANQFIHLKVEMNYNKKRFWIDRERVTGGSKTMGQTSGSDRNYIYKDNDVENMIKDINEYLQNV